MAYLLGIDLGTSSAKALIMDETGTVVSCGSCGYDLSIPAPGYAEQDSEVLWQGVCTAVRAALRGHSIADRIAGIGLSGQMHGLVMLDADMKPVRPVIIWADQRSTEQIEELKHTDLQERVGNPMATGFFLPSLLWVRKYEPWAFEQMRHAMLPKDYIRYRLCGALGTDFSDASGTLLYNLHTRTWDKATLEAFGIEAEVLPACSPSSSVAGKLTQEAGEQTGLCPGTPVVYGGGDTPMQLLGNGVLRHGQLCTNIGTASQISCISESIPWTAGKLNTFHHIPSDRWIAAGASLNGGLVLKWLRSVLGVGGMDFQDMDSFAQQSVPGANGVVMLPFLCGERSPYMDENAKGILFGMTLSTTSGDIVRSAMESVVFSFRDCMGVLEEQNFPVGDELIASGGGARSPVWLQMQADILVKQVRTHAGKEQACIGAAIAAGVGCGIYGSLEEGSDMVLRLSDRIFEPNLENSRIYSERFALYRELYRSNKQLFQRFG